MIVPFEVRWGTCVVEDLFIYLFFNFIGQVDFGEDIKPAFSQYPYLGVVLAITIIFSSVSRH